MAKAFFLERLTQFWPPELWSDHRSIIAVSGGADSVALLRALTEIARHNNLIAGQRLSVGHYNHRLRGPAADEDEAFVCQLAQQLGLPCFVARNTRTSTSVPNEETLRRERYTFLEDAARQWGARYIVTAHTRDDQCETVLFRLLRGTSISGLRGMARERPVGADISLVRPLLWARRADVEDFLDSIQQPWRNDLSNQSPDFTRNRIRHEVLPLLATLHPHAAENIAAIAESAAEYHALAAQLAADLIERITIANETNRVRLNLHALIDAPPLLIREAFVSIWKRHHWPLGNMSRAHWNRLAWLASATTEQIAASGPHAHVFPGNIHVKRLAANVLEIEQLQVPNSAQP